MAETKKSSKSKGQKKGAEKRKAELPAKRKRQYKHIEESEKKEGRSTKSAKRIAMAIILRPPSAFLFHDATDGCFLPFFFSVA